MLLNIVLLAVGFVLLIKGADIFVDGASSLAENFKVPKMVIALTIVAFGTSAPELAVSIQAILKGSSEMVIGNVVGSNILNILLILGLSSLFSPMGVKDDTVHKEIPLTILFSTLLMAVCFDNMFDHKITNVISRTDGLIIILFFAIFIYYLVSVMKNRDKEKDTKPKYNLLLSIVFVFISKYSEKILFPKFSVEILVLLLYDSFLFRNSPSNLKNFKIIKFFIFYVFLHIKILLQILIYH